MANNEMNVLKIGNSEFTIADAQARQDVSELKEDFDSFPNGNYPNMTVGNADQLVSTVFTEDSTPYNFRTTGGSADVGDREHVDAIVGGTVALNQLVEEVIYSETSKGITRTKINDSTFTISGTAEERISTSILNSDIAVLANHVYFLHGMELNTQDIALIFNGYNDRTYVTTYTQSDKGNGAIIKNTNGSVNTARIELVINNGTALSKTYAVTPQFTDLTQMFGTTIADYVYGLETATAGAGVAWLKQHFPKIFNAGYVPYNAGTLVGVSGLSAHKTVGFNQWDEQWEVGSYSTATGEKVEQDSCIRSKNYIPVFPNVNYYFTCLTTGISLYALVFFYDSDYNYLGQVRNGVYPPTSSEAAGYNNPFTTPSSARYMTFRMSATYGNVYKHDVCFNLSWDGEKNGQYEPYVEHTYPLDDSLTLRGIPKLDAQNNLYYDGDEYLPDGTVNRRYVLLNAGSLNWTYDASSLIGSPCFYTNTISSMKKGSSNLIMPNYVTKGNRNLIDGNMQVAVGNNTDAQYLVLTNNSYTDPADLKASFDNVYWLVELATPTTETAEPYQQTQICDDFGTEAFVSTSPVPVGHNTRYAPNLRAKLEMAPDSPDGDGVYVVQQSNGENTYVPLGSTTTIQNILDRLTALENA